MLGQVMLCTFQLGYAVLAYARPTSAMLGQIMFSYVEVGRLCCAMLRSVMLYCDSVLCCAMFSQIRLYYGSVCYARLACAMLCCAMFSCQAVLSQTVLNQTGLFYARKGCGRLYVVEMGCVMLLCCTDQFGMCCTELGYNALAQFVLRCVELAVLDQVMFSSARVYWARTVGYSVAKLG